MNTRTLVLAAALSLMSFNVSAADQPTVFEPTVDQLHAYKAYHHAEYLKETAKQAGGTNKLLHTRQLPTEGADAVVTPSLDHLYSKAVIDLTHGPVYLEMPVVKGRYFSMEVHDQEHYATFYKLRPSGKFVFVDYKDTTKFPDDVTVIKDRGFYPHLLGSRARERLSYRAGTPGLDVKPIDIPTPFANFDDYGQPFLGGQGPAPSYAMSLDETARARLRDRIRERIPTAANGTISLTARAWAARGTVGK